MAYKLVAAYNIAAPSVISSSSPLTVITGISSISVLTQGSAGQLVANDCTTLASASIANQLFSMPYNEISPYVDMPLQSGLVFSQVPTGMVFAVTYQIYLPSPPKLVRQMAFNITAPGLISPRSPLSPIAGLLGFNLLTQGSAGNLIFNDAASLAQASMANQIATIPYQQTEGLPIDWPVQNGLVASAVPTGGVFSVLYRILAPAG